MSPEPIRRRTGEGVPYEQYPRCTETMGNAVKRYRCTLPVGHVEERTDFHVATDGRNSFIWSAKK